MPMTTPMPRILMSQLLRKATQRAQRAGIRALYQRLLSSVLALLLSVPINAQASMFKGEALDKVADILAIVILIFVPIGVIALFWMVHVLPEKIAEKRHHPQQTAIKTLCLLSLVFGGLLWPIAWLWAYTKPIGYKLAYGTDKHESYFKEACEQAERGELPRAQLEAIRQELAVLAERGQLTPELRAVRYRLGLLQTSVPFVTPPDTSPDTPQKLTPPAPTPAAPSQPAPSQSGQFEHPGGTV